MEYVCRDPKAKVRSPNISILVETFRFMPSIIDKLLDKHGLTRATFTSHEYVPVTTVLAILKDIHERIGPEKLRQIGSMACEVALFPPQFVGVEGVLLALDVIYSLNHLGEVGHYHSTKLPDGAIEVRCATPYPPVYERGIIEGIARNPNLALGRRYHVDYEALPPGRDETCVCTVRESSR